MAFVGARPDELRRLATLLDRTVEEAAWLRRRVNEAQAWARIPFVDTRVLARLELWLSQGAGDVRRRAALLEDGWLARGGLLDDFHPPGVMGGGCGSVAVPVFGRKVGPDGRDSSLGEPLFASAPLACMPVTRLAEKDALQLIVTPDGRLVLASRSGRGGGGGAGGPALPKPTKEEVLDKLRLPHGDVEFGFVPKRDWHPENGLQWDRERRGYVDAKDNAWRKGPSRTPGQPFEWDVQLGSDSRWRKVSKDGMHLNIDLDGRISH